MFDNFWHPIAKAGNGVMIAAWPSETLAQQLAIPDGEAADDLHVTIAYFGKELTSQAIDTIHRVLARVCESFPPLLDGTLSGEGRFPANPSTEGRDVLVRLADIPRLETLRERILIELEALDIEAFRNHGYCPHMTMAYVDPLNRQLPPMKTFPFPVERITLSVGKLRVHYPLSGSSTQKHVKADFKFCKANEEERRVFGWASVSEIDGKPVVDHHADIITPKDMEEMAYRFLEVRTGGEMHDTMGVSRLIESMVFTKEKQEALGIDLGMVGWWVGFQVMDESTWKKVKSGELRSFSIGGRGFRQSAS